MRRLSLRLAAVGIDLYLVRRELYLTIDDCEDWSSRLLLRDLRPGDLSTVGALELSRSIRQSALPAARAMEVLVYALAAR